MTTIERTVTWILLHAAGENDLMSQCFRGGQNKIVLCETFKYNKKPTETNHRCQQKTTLNAKRLKKSLCDKNCENAAPRKSCNTVMERARDQKPWFGEIIINQIWETDLGCPHDIIIIILVHLRDRAGVHSVRHGPPPVRLAKEWIPRFKYS